MRSMYIPATVCVRAQGVCGLRSLLTPQRALGVTTVDEKLEEGKEVGRRGRRRNGVDGQVRSFEEIPHTGRNGWVNLVKFWREDRFRHLHMHTERTFNALGPIYRYHIQ